MEELSNWVVAVQNGDLDAYGIIVRRFQDMAVGYALTYLNDYHLAEDAAQEAFIEAFGTIANLREPAAFAGWFRPIVRKHCNRLVRGKQLKTVPLDEASQMPSIEPTPDEMAIDIETKDTVMAAVQTLSENQRVVTTLFHLNGYSQNEIADFLEVPVTTVKKRLHDAKKRLKERMLNMETQDLQENRPSRDDQFVNRVQFFNAVEAGQVEKAGALLTATPALVNATTEGRRTPLHVASRYGYKEIMELLLASGAAVDAKDKNGRTPLHHMIPHSTRTDVAELLLTHGADINTTDNMGTTPASLTVSNEMEEGWPYQLFRKFLFEKSAAPDIFVIMWESESEKVGAFLKAHPTQVNVQLKSAGGLPGATPLYFAVRLGYRRIVEILLQYGADLNALDDKSRPPLYLVWNDYDPQAQAERALMVELLLRHGVELDVFSAAAIGRTDLVTQLLSADPALIHATDAGGNTPLHLAAWKREPEMVKLLLAKGADPNLQNERGEMSVFMASDCRNDCEFYEPRADEIRRLLVQHGATCDIWTAARFGSVAALDACLRGDPTLLNTPDEEGFTPLQLATHVQPAVEFLLKKGAQLDIFTAVRLGKRDHIVALLDADKALINSRTIEDITPLVAAVDHGQEAVVKYLLERGAAIDAKDAHGYTPGLQAASNGNKGLVEFLLEQGADINARDKLNESLLHLAVVSMGSTDTEFVKWLASHGADIHARNLLNNTPLHYAARGGKINLVQFFLEQGMDINDPGYGNLTPLHQAARHGYVTLTQFLLEREAEVNLQSEGGKTPLQLAMKDGHEGAADLLRQHGATE